MMSKALTVWWSQQRPILKGYLFPGVGIGRFFNEANMIITTVQTYDYETWYGKYLRFFDTDTGIDYRFTLTAGDNALDAVRLNIESAHAPLAENEYGLEYAGKQAIMFMRQMGELLQDKELANHWCDEAMRYLGMFEEAEAKREEERARVSEFDDVPF
jgi:hypothetical protein